MLSPIFNFNVIVEPESVAIKFVLLVAEDALPFKLPINFAAVIFLPDAVMLPLKFTPDVAFIDKVLLTPEISGVVTLPLKFTPDVASMDKVLLTPEISGVVTLVDVEIVPEPVQISLLPVTMPKLDKVPPALLDISVTPIITVILFTLYPSVAVIVVV